MKLYLSSYRVGNNPSVLEEWAKNNKQIIVIPNALDMFPDGERKSNSVIEKCIDLQRLGFEPIIIDLKDFFHKEDKLKSFLKNYNSFYVLGGNVFVLRQAMSLSGFDKYLSEISNNPNCLYAGFSAGICVLSKDLHGIHLVDDPTIKPYGDYDTIWSGIGLIDYMPVPHCDTPDHPESQLMNEAIKYLKENNLPYKTLRDGDVICEEIIENNKIED